MLGGVYFRCSDEHHGLKARVQGTLHRTSHGLRFQPSTAALVPDISELFLKHSQKQASENTHTHLEIELGLVTGIIAIQDGLGYQWNIDTTKGFPCSGGSMAKCTSLAWR